MSDIIKTQRSLAIKAEHNPNHRFDHLYRLICRKDWIKIALKAVLSNRGARTTGIDGVDKKTLVTETSQEEFIEQLQSELRSKNYRPQPVLRVFIPKSNGKKRPLGIANIKDRVVQMLIKMVLEPIYESDFLNCSNGFRPERRTQDCIALLDSYINRRGKFYWVIEGDIKGAFDSIHHQILLNIMSQRIADRRLLTMIQRFLKAGVMENSLFKRTELGTPQGGICSPLLANIYLHQFDLYWWNKYKNLHLKEKERRRKNHMGNCALIRYADDWLLLTNGGKAEAIRLRDEFQTFLKTELKLELSIEKTHITHVNNGFDFLGFHIRRYVSGHDRPKVLVTPSKKVQKRLKSKIKEMTSCKRFRDMPLLKFTALNSVLRGWINYYRHSNTKDIAKNLDFWVNKRLFIWLKKRHRLRIRRILKMYKHRENGKRVNCGIRNGEKMLYLYRMSDLSLTKYRSRSLPNPYMVRKEIISIEELEVPLPEQVWLGNARNNEILRVLKEAVKAEKGDKCAVCGNFENLDLHHIIPRRKGGQDVLENVQLLCRSCHAKTSSYGNHRR